MITRIIFGHYRKSPKRVAIVVGLFALLLLGNDVEFAQSDDDAPVKVDTILLSVPVVVSDIGGRNIAGLKKEDFSVFQNGRKQTVAFFADQDEPMTVALVIDTSVSTGRVLTDIRKAARGFVDFFGPDDKGIIVRFDKDVKVMNELTSDKNKLRKTIDRTETDAAGGSNMNDAIYEVVKNQFAATKGKKAIIVLTDGYVDGKVSKQQLLNTLIESDVLVYPIFFQTLPIDVHKYDPTFSRNAKSISMSELVKIPPVDYLFTIALETGGRLYAADGSDFEGAFQNIATELKKQYVIGFYPTETADGASKQISIEVNRKDVVVRTKQSIRPKNAASKVN